jgi:hypothetical protein
MPLLQVVASTPLQGKSAVAAALALGLARAGYAVRLVRTGADAGAEPDAESFAALTFAGSPGRPLPAGSVPPAGRDEVVIVEGEAGTVPLAGAPVLFVVRGDADEGVAALARPLGERLLGSVATAVLQPDIEGVLAAPCVSEIRDALGAELLYDGDNPNEVVEDVLIAPVYADPARPHFARFRSKAVLTPYNKTDLLLSAIDSGAACLVITGRGRPSPYVLDRAQGESTTVLLSGRETPETLYALSDVWSTSRFRGEIKAEAACAHLAKRIDFASLARKIGP